MIDFLIIFFIVFLIVKKHYSISKKENAGQGDDHTTFFFTVFMLTCSVLWLVFKYAYKWSPLLLIGLVFWPNIRKFFSEINPQDPAKSDAARRNIL